MKTIKYVCYLCVLLTCVAPLSPTLAQTEAAATSSFTQDIALNADGELTGQMVDRNGAPLPAAKVSLLTGSQERQTTTDDDGNYRFDGLQGGVYLITAADQELVCRAWAANTAPPAASNGLLLVVDDQQVERGQCNCNGGNCNCQSQNQRRILNGGRNPRRRKLLFAGGRIGMKAAMLPFMAAGALGAADDDDDEAETEDGADDNGDTGTAS